MPKKGLFWQKSLKNSEKKRQDEQKWLSFWAFKSQNLEKVYKIKIKNHAILHLLQLFFF